MNPVKSQVKLLTIQNIGENLDDAKERAQREALRFEGARAGYKNGIEKIKIIVGYVDTDLKEGKFPDFKDSLEIAEYIKTYIG